MMRTPAPALALRVWTALPVLAFIATGLLAVAGPAASQTVDLDDFEVQEYVRGLREPVAFDFLGPGELFVFERRTGNVRWIRDGEIVRTVYRAKVNAKGGRGGLGIALDPDFANNRFVYLFYSASSRNGGPWLENRVERLRFDGTDLGRAKTLLAFENAGSNDDPDQNGGVLRFGPDGNLYGLVGSLGRGDSAAAPSTRSVEQNVDRSGSSGVGGIFRVDSKGKDVGDNPFIDNADREVRKWFVYGVRDGIGLAFDPVRGYLWFTERGPGVYDEINRAAAGMNSGWLPIMGPDSRDAAYEANDNVGGDAADLVSLPGSRYADPAFSFAEAAGIGPLAFLQTDAYGGGLRDRLLVGDADGDLHLFRLNKPRKRLKLSGPVRDRVADGATETARSVWGRDFGDVRDLRVGPDGLLYVVDRLAGRILRVVPVLAEEDRTVRYRVTFDATWSASTHPDPRFPGNPHFSGLIGGTHDPEVTFWEDGGTASDGIKNMAETGSKSPFNEEIGAAIAAGTAQNLLSGGNIGLSPAAVSMEFDINVDFPLVTLVSMLAPSPDWFVGVHGLSLFEGNAWIEELAVELFAYDAGTDAGESFNSANAPLEPRDPITRFNGPPFAPAGSVAPVGRFIFERIE